MALTPEDVVNKRFQPTKFREGYDQDEVDDFLDEIVVEFRRLNQENDELRKKLAELQSKPQAAGASAAPVVSKVSAADEKRDDASTAVKGSKDKAGSKDERAAKDSGSATSSSAKSDTATTDKSGSKDVTPGKDDAAAVPSAQATAAVAAPAAANVVPAHESAAGVLAMAQRLHDEYVTAGVEQRDKIISEAQIEASGLVNDAQEKSRKTLGALEQQRSVLERKVEQLRGFERDYRSRLKAYIEGQLRDLDSRGSVAASDAPEASSAS